MNAHEGTSTVESPAGTGAVVLTAGMGSPVRTASSHSSWLASNSRRSAGTRSPTRRATTSPGTSSRTSRRCWLPSRQTRAWWRMLACSAATASSERYSLMKPSPTLKTTIAAMMTPSVGSPVAAETPAAASNRMSSGLRSWRPRTPRAVTLWVASTLRPTVANRLAAPSEDRPTGELPSSWSTTLTGLWAAAARSSGGRCDHAGGAGEATLLTACSPSRGGPSDRQARQASFVGIATSPLTNRCPQQPAVGSRGACGG